MRSVIVALALAGGTPLAAAELTVGAGATLPSYDQRFAFDPAGLLPGGFSLRGPGGFGLEASGALALYGSLTVPLAGPLSAEARVDAARIDTAVLGNAVGSTRIPGIALAAGGIVETDRLVPISLGLRLGLGPLYVAGGATWMRATRFTARVDTVLQVDLGGQPLELPVAGVTATGELPGGIGGHAGAGLGIGILPRVRLVLEGRGFVLPEGTIAWDESGSAASRELASRLDPIRIRPAFFQATAAIAVSF